MRTWLVHEVIVPPTLSNHQKMSSAYLKRLIAMKKLPVLKNEMIDCWQLQVLAKIFMVNHANFVLILFRIALI